MRVFLRLLGVAMIISAAVLFFWQDIREIFTDRVNDRIIEAYQNGESSVDVGGFESMVTGISTEAGDDDTEEAREGINIGEGMAGVLKIDSAGINEPVFEGPVTEEKMKNGVSFVNGTDHPDMQNIPIAGHRVEGAGIRFNYLDRASVGDRIEFITEDGTRVYEITDIFDVNPSQVEVMDQREGQPQQLTLITCEDYNPETLLFEKRMIVKATIVE
ncbi:MAG TPA: sortase [Candidatus Salinicoccus stercoripullorum]|uniref:Sortase n=1 Tax=Candidatus Salinicoccus stercoripullorum TaxID=2838756 RepID=A0A9D1QGN9_9STAP|nr:sortase [Candidatus Salinicoccus stercoripullorum]